MRRRRVPFAPSVKIDLDGNLISEKKEKDVNELTLLQTIERVVELSKDSELDDEFLESAEPVLTLLSSRLGVTPVQAVLFNADGVKGLKEGRLADVTPTLLDLMGLKQPADMDGKSLLIRG